MALIVQKYGGTSVGSLDRIRAVAQRVARAKADGHDVVVAVSAMAGETNRLLALAHELSQTPNQRELDAMIATGETVSTALVSMALWNLGVPARSLQAHQARIQTDSVHGKARILSIDAPRLLGAIERGEVAVVAGFQGTDAEGNVTTLGRGGSDTTAVALAAALEADVCEIYTDVDGIYTTDPNVVPTARKIHRISYEEMLELASLGAKVLQTRSVEFAMKYNVPIHVRSSFSDAEGSWVTKEDTGMEQVVVSAVAYDRNEAKISLLGVPDVPGRASVVFNALSEKSIVVDMIIQNASQDGRTDLTFTVPKSDADQAAEIIRGLEPTLGFDGLRVDRNIAKVSIVGVGMRSHSGIAARMFKTLADAGVNIEMISTSEIKISCVINGKYTELAVRELHDAFGLSEEQVQEDDSFKHAG